MNMKTSLKTLNKSFLAFVFVVVLTLCSATTMAFATDYSSVEEGALSSSVSISDNTVIAHNSYEMRQYLDLNFPENDGSFSVDMDYSTDNVNWVNYTASDIPYGTCIRCNDYAFIYFYTNKLQFYLNGVGTIYVKFNILTHGDDTFVPDPYVTYSLEVPKGYAVVVSGAPNLDLSTTVKLLGNTESDSTFPVFKYATSTGIVLSSSNYLPIKDTGIFLDEQNITFYQDNITIPSDGSSVIVVPYLNVLRSKGSITETVIDVSTIDSVFIGGNTSTVPYTSLSLHKITQSHTLYNYVTVSSDSIPAVLNSDGTVSWASSVSDQTNTSTDSSSSDIWSNGLSYLHDLTNSASNFFTSISSIFSWLPTDIQYLIKGCLGVMLVLGVIKVIL